MLKTIAADYILNITLVLQGKDILSITVILGLYLTFVWNARAITTSE
jgi:hypothetical protein